VTGTLGESLVDEIDGQTKNRTGLDRLEPDADSQASGHGRGRWRGGRRAKEAPARTSAGRRSLKHVGCAVAARARQGGAKQRSHASTRRGRLTGGQSRPPQARGSKIPEERGSRRRHQGERADACEDEQGGRLADGHGRSRACALPQTLAA